MVAAKNTTNRVMRMASRNLSRQIVLSLSFLAALPLIVAALTKSYALLVIGHGYEEVYAVYVLVGLITLELFVGWLVLSGLWGYASVWIGIALYFVFLITAFAKLAVGTTNCGCFGLLEIHPGITVLIDTFAICCLVAITRRPLEKTSSCHRRLVVASIIFVAFYLPVVVWLSSPSEGSRRTSDGDLVFAYGKGAEPTLGRRLVTIDLLADGRRLEEGDWLVLFYRVDCDDCRQLLVMLEEIAFRFPQHNIGYVIVPEYMSSTGQLVNRMSNRFELSASLRWVANTPRVLELHDGIVIKVISGVAGLEDFVLVESKPEITH